jgi:hypothetical protein
MFARPAATARGTVGGCLPTSVDRDYDPFGRPDILSVLLTRQG